ncbi:MAG: EpsG family protein [Clostridia bacterium]|nr:EpsG family protein [Clostridia bacterium]
MIIYYLLFVIILLCGLYSIYVNTNEYDNTYHSKSVLRLVCDKLFKDYLFVVLLLIVFGAYRGFRVGLDNPMYLSYYHALEDNFAANWSLYGFEFGYRVINAFAYGLNIGYFGVQLICTTIIVLSFYRFINTFSLNKTISWLLFLCLGIYAQSLCIVRQMLALSFVLHAIISLYNKKYFRYVIYTIIAVLFHKSALITLVYLPLAFIPLSEISVAIYTACATLVSVTFIPLFKLFVKIFDSRYAYYIFGDIGEFNTPVSLPDMLFTIGMLVLFIVVFLFKDKLSKTDQLNNNKFLTLFLFVPLIRMFGAYIQFPTLSQRITPYFFFSIIVIVPYYLKLIKEKYTKWYVPALVVTIAGALVYMYFLYAVKVSCGVVPYNFEIL